MILFCKNIMQPSITTHAFLNTHYAVTFEFQNQDKSCICFKNQNFDHMVMKLLLSDSRNHFATFGLEIHTVRMFPMDALSSFWSFPY